MLDDICIDERTRKAWGNSGLIECRLSHAIRASKHNEASPYFAVSAVARTRLTAH